MILVFHTSSAVVDPMGSAWSWTWSAGATTVVTVSQVFTLQGETLRVAAIGPDVLSVGAVLPDVLRVETIHPDVLHA